jgi:hypothetical protein
MPLIRLGTSKLIKYEKKPKSKRLNEVISKGKF